MRRRDTLADSANDEIKKLYMRMTQDTEPYDNQATPDFDKIMQYPINLNETDISYRRDRAYNSAL